MSIHYCLAEGCGVELIPRKNLRGRYHCPKGHGEYLVTNEFYDLNSLIDEQLEAVQPLYIARARRVLLAKEVGS